MTISYIQRLSLGPLIAAYRNEPDRLRETLDAIPPADFGSCLLLWIDSLMACYGVFEYGPDNRDNIQLSYQEADTGNAVPLGQVRRPYRLASRLALARAYDDREGFEVLYEELVDGDPALFGAVIVALVRMAANAFASEGPGLLAAGLLQDLEEAFEASPAGGDDEELPPPAPV